MRCDMSKGEAARDESANEASRRMRACSQAIEANETVPVPRVAWNQEKVKGKRVIPHIGLHPHR